LTFAGVLFFARLGVRAFWSEEVRWAEIPREMQLSGDYLWPTSNGRTYYGKPLGSYWLVLLASALTGSLDETSARLPSAVSGLLGVALVILLARRLYDDRTAILAGLILTTCFSFVFFARHASTDVETVTGVLAALYVFVRNERHPQGWWTLPFWLVMALTSLTKGLLGFALPILIVGAYCTFADPFRPLASSVGGWVTLLVHRNRWLFNRTSLVAVPLGVIVYLSPFLLSFGVTGSTEGLGKIVEENVQRFFNPVNHRGPVYLYLPVIFLLMAPWSLLLPAALVRAHTDAQPGSERSRPDRFVLVYFWATFLFFTLAASRRSYYLLPVLPAGALLVARLLARPDESLGRTAFRFLAGGYGLLAVAMILSGAALLPVATFLPPPWCELPALPSPLVFGLLWTISVAGIYLAVRRFETTRMAASLVVIACSFALYLFVCFLPASDAYRTQKSFAEAVKQHLGADAAGLALFRTSEIVFYLGQPHPIPEYKTSDDLREGIQSRAVRWVIVRRRDRDRLGVPAEVLLAEPVHPWQGRPAAETKLLLLRVSLER
jgi:hypothetical protein